MHMADALLSPSVGGAMWVVSGGLIAYCARRVRQSLRDTLVPMMGVLGAFIFTAQMINFSIPLTGSSGHLGGGLILAILLGPHAAFLVIASVLTVQALFFADGGLLALGCNMFNLGFFPAFIACPLVYRVISQDQQHTPRAWTAAIVAGIVGLQLGAFSVILETKASGISDLPFGLFALLMQPIHLAIGVVEGLATATIVAFVARARPEAFPTAPATEAPSRLRPVLLGLLLTAIVLGALASWFASTHPDGLEWAIAKVSGGREIPTPEAGVHSNLARVQAKTAILPDYGFKSSGTESGPGDSEGTAPWPVVSAGTSLSGLVGGLTTLALAGLIGLALRKRPARKG